MVRCESTREGGREGKRKILKAGEDNEGQDEEEKNMEAGEASCNMGLDSRV